MPTAISTFSHFAVLGLPEPTTSSSSLTQAEIKTAYKRALLLHHPDKAKADISRANLSSSIPSVDEITLAYRILSSPTKQRDYIYKLLASRTTAPGTASLGNQPASKGLELVDLDDMLFDDQTNMYYRSCRCGRQRGYIVSEAQLEESIEDGEVDVGCEGCSLWIRIEYGVAGG